MSGHENKWEAIDFFPNFHNKNEWTRLKEGSDAGGWTAVKRMVTRETRLYMPSTPLTNFHTSHVHVKKAGNS